MKYWCTATRRTAVPLWLQRITVQILGTKRHQALLTQIPSRFQITTAQVRLVHWMYHALVMRVRYLLNWTLVTHTSVTYVLR